MTRKCPLKKKCTVTPPDLAEFLKEELVIKDEQFLRKIDEFYLKMVNWIVQMNSDLLSDTKMKIKDIARNTEFLKVRANLIIIGLDLATDIKRNIKTLLLMY